MSAYDFYKSRFHTPITQGSNILTVGEQLKIDSDMVMEETWWNDPQSKICYIYDYFHDDQPELAQKMTYEHTTKTRIDAKFIVKQSSSVAKDQVEYYLLFRPSQKTDFVIGDELYYFETNYKSRFNIEFPISLFIDIPNEKGIYYKWLICGLEYGNQFIKYSVLPCDYKFMWIEDTGTERLKRQMWCSTRAMNSYTTGLWIDRYVNIPNDVQKVWLPLNSITEKIRFVNGSKNNQRVLMGAVTEKPLAWQVSKLEVTKPMGILKITLDQDQFNPHTDYVNIDTHEMYADYYTSLIKPIDDENPADGSSENIVCHIETSSNTIKVGGSYKLLKFRIYDNNQTDITENYISTSSNILWKCFINNTDMTDSDLITWQSQDDPASIKIKVANDREYLNSILLITCTTDNIDLKISDSIELELAI